MEDFVGLGKKKYRPHLRRKVDVKKSQQERTERVVNALKDMLLLIRDHRASRWMDWDVEDADDARLYEAAERLARQWHIN